MISIRPHHFLDLLRDHGLDRPRGEHPFGASVHAVADALFADPGQELRLVMGVDDICVSCARLEAGICQALIRNGRPMRAYNDALDAALFARLGLQPGVVLPMPELLAQVEADPSLLELFTSPDNDGMLRRQGTRLGIERVHRRL